jgi:hypothetical protein
LEKVSRTTIDFEIQKQALASCCKEQAPGLTKNLHPVCSIKRKLEKSDVKTGIKTRLIWGNRW